MKKPEEICLAVIQQVHATLPNAHGIPPILFYLQAGGLDPADINSIQYVVSHIEDQGKWGLINCSSLLAHAIFAKVN